MHTTASAGVCEVAAVIVYVGLHRPMHCTRPTIILSPSATLPVLDTDH